MLLQIKHNKDKTIYPFDKGSRFVVLSEKNTIQEIGEQLGKVKIAENDPTLKLINRIHEKLCRLRKEKKLQIENKSKYIHEIPYHRDCMVQ